MRRILLFFLMIPLLLIASGCGSSNTPAPTTLSTTATTAPATESATSATEPIPEPLPTEAETTVPTQPPLELTVEEQEMLLKIGMAELGNEDCTECIALVMRTVLNRVEADRFGSSIRSVLFAQDQFTPVMDGSYYKAEPNERCYEALDMILHHWDESQGALYYEWCEGESWHSKNLNLLFQHCDVRFYTSFC